MRLVFPRAHDLRRYLGIPMTSDMLSSQGWEESIIFVLIIFVLTTTNHVVSLLMID